MRLGSGKELPLCKLQGRWRRGHSLKESLSCEACEQFAFLKCGDPSKTGQGGALQREGTTGAGLPETPPPGVQGPAGGAPGGPPSFTQGNIGWASLVDATNAAPRVAQGPLEECGSASSRDFTKRGRQNEPLLSIPCVCEVGQEMKQFA